MGERAHLLLGIGATAITVSAAIALASLSTAVIGALLGATAVYDAAIVVAGVGALLFGAGFAILSYIQGTRNTTRLVATIARQIPSKIQ